VRKTPQVIQVGKFSKLTKLSVGSKSEAFLSWMFCGWIAAK